MKQEDSEGQIVTPEIVAKITGAKSILKPRNDRGGNHGLSQLLGRGID